MLIIKVESKEISMKDSTNKTSSNHSDSFANEAQQKSQNNFFAAIPNINLPKGGGAIRGIGEKFAVNSVNGTCSFTIPIAVSPGRACFNPLLSLTYDSGAGNGPFGLGWTLSLPSITRKADKGLPRYNDQEESDVFILSGAEDLVPVPIEENGEQKKFREDDTYFIYLYRPRIEGLFARIERWQHKETGITHWRSISKDNITTIYGKPVDDNSPFPCIIDPNNPTRIFSWLISQSYDDKGNAIIYEYKEENAKEIKLSQTNEKNRTDENIKANRYLKSIKYGNHISHLVEHDLSKLQWMFEVVFDYGEHDSLAPKPNDAGIWASRHDPFSSYRAGFEVRTYRLCKRVLMFHHFTNDKEVGINCLVRSTDFIYQDNSGIPDSKQGAIPSTIISVIQNGYKIQNNSYLKKSMPPLEFNYTQAVIQEDVRDIDTESLKNLPYGLDNTNYQWVDLDGEGLSGILTEQANAWFYKPNLGEGYFGSLERVALKPSLAALSSGRQQLMDLAGDGQLDLVEFSGPVPGFYERTEEQSWENFKPFTSLPNIPWNDPNLRFVDLNGDGHADILISENEIFTWYPSLAEEGFSRAQKIYNPVDEEKGPRLVFADGEQSIYLADLSGDGLTDIVRIRNGGICYWPNLGYGKFGEKITMDNAPSFDTPDQFDQKRIHLADIDGSGTTDIIYLKHDGVHIYFNLFGNSWSNSRVLEKFPPIDNVAHTTVIDLLGKGTACLVWSSPLPGNAKQPMRYIDLMSKGKPHLLITTRNNLGAETTIQYASSTKFYLDDKKAGKSWVTRLPFPVHVVERIETRDEISRNCFVTRYAYHHGYFDGEEREFRGFGMVDQWDTEKFALLSHSDPLIEESNRDETFHIPPVHTKTWFHTGAFVNGLKISHFLAHEYYGAPTQGPDDSAVEEFFKTLLDDTVLPTTVSLRDNTELPFTLTINEAREACRSLKGSMLRQEIYAEDESEKSEIPYSVSERNYTIKCLQQQGNYQHGIFYVHPRESLSYHYERNIQNPRIQHELVLEVDFFGNILKSIAIGYGRKFSDLEELEDSKKQINSLIIYTENEVTNSINDTQKYPHAYRTPVIWQTGTYELTGFTLTNQKRFTLDDFIEKRKNEYNQFISVLKFQKDLQYEERPGTGFQGRLIEYIRTYFRPDDLGKAKGNSLTLLDAREIESLALPGESYKLAFTSGLLSKIYRRKNGTQEENLLPNPGSILQGQAGDSGGYFDLDKNGNWWIRAGRIFYHDDVNATPDNELIEAREHFFLPRRVVDPFGKNSKVEYDEYSLLPLCITDAVQNTVKSTNDYRVLQPKIIQDPNNNRTTVAFDALGMVVATAVMGKEGEKLGDSLEDEFKADLTPDEIDRFFNNPLSSLTTELLGNATSRIIYNLDSWKEVDPHKKSPPFAATIVRETHISDLLSPNDESKIQVNFSYSDGFGREIQKKIQAEAGPLDLDDISSPIIDSRWVGSGWIVFNNKGKPIFQYEPFFDDTHQFKFGYTVGVSSVLFYDPLERVIATLHPNNTYEKVTFDPWQQTTWDVNDTVLLDPRTDPDICRFTEKYIAILAAQPGGWRTWYDNRKNGELGDKEQSAAIKTAEAQVGPLTNLSMQESQGTPTVIHFDVLGRPFLTITDNGKDKNKQDRKYKTRVELDIEGNQREVRDAIIQHNDNLGRIVMRYEYDMLGNRLYQSSMEAGERWMLNDVTGKPIRIWNSRKYYFRTEYDELRRPLKSYVQGGDSSDPNNKIYPQEIMIERTIYGDSQDTGLNEQEQQQVNVRGKIYKHFDTAGIVTNYGINPLINKPEAYDFKGNLLRSCRQFTQDYKLTPDWLQPSILQQLDQEIFVSTMTFDALNRIHTTTTPDNSVYRPIYNEANLLNKVEVNLRGAKNNNQLVWTTFVNNIDYNAKGQRTRIEYGLISPDKAVAVTEYQYDKNTFRLMHLKTTRSTNTNGLASQLFNDLIVIQDLRYTYDPAGNITHIFDDALKTIFHDQEEIKPSCDYTYDALYRLIIATGREHIGQCGIQFKPPNNNYRDYSFVGSAHQNDLQAVRAYTELYDYDPVGNFQQIAHQANNGNWTRSYNYNEKSLIENDSNSSAKTNNRLSNTIFQPNGNQPILEPYIHDAHGNITNMPHLSSMQWDFKDQLCATTCQIVNNGTPEITYYVYASNGQRVRKITELQNGKPKNERLYLNGFEIYREYTNGTVNLERETLHVMDDKQRIALVETKVINNSNPITEPIPIQRYQLGNHLGSAILELDEAGALISCEEYFPYGGTSYQAHSAAEVSMKRYRYTGKERDEENGFYYHGARYYAPWLGRWMAADPIGIQDGNNLYLYVKGNPICKLDFMGTQSSKANIPVDEMINQLDQGENPFQLQGKPGIQSPYTSMDIDEIQAVGEEGISSTEALARAKDVNNRQFLHSRTNRLTKYLGTETSASPELRSPISVTEDPNALITRRFGEVTEMQDIFNEALGKIKDPQKLSPIALKERINSYIWNIIKKGKGEAAVRVRDALKALGFENISRKGYVLKTGQGASEAMKKAATSSENTTLSNEVKSVTSNVEAVGKSELKQEVKALVSTEAKAGANVMRSETTLLARAGGASGVASKALFVANIYFAYEDYKEGAKNSTGEGILNAAGTLGGIPSTGTILRQALEFDSMVHDPAKLWNAVKSGASPVSIGMGMVFGAFR